MHVRRILLFATALVVPIAHAQSTVMSIPDPAPAAQPAASDAKQITFDVVSIKQNKSDSMGGSARSMPDGVTFVNTTLLFQIAPAYGVELDEVYGLPDWAKDNHYDIQYKVAAEDIAAYRKLPRAESQAHDPGRPRRPSQAQSPLRHKRSSHVSSSSSQRVAPNSTRPSPAIPMQTV